MSNYKGRFLLPNYRGRISYLQSPTPRVSFPTPVTKVEYSMLSILPLTDDISTLRVDFPTLFRKVANYTLELFRPWVYFSYPYLEPILQCTVNYDAVNRSHVMEQTL